MTGSPGSDPRKKKFGSTACLTGLTHRPSSLSSKLSLGERRSKDGQNKMLRLEKRGGIEKGGMV